MIFKRKRIVQNVEKLPLEELENENGKPYDNNKSIHNAKF